MPWKRRPAAIKSNVMYVGLKKRRIRCIIIVQLIIIITMQIVFQKKQTLNMIHNKKKLRLQMLWISSEPMKLWLTVKDQKVVKVKI